MASKVSGQRYSVTISVSTGDRHPADAARGLKGFERALKRAVADQGGFYDGSGGGWGVRDFFAYTDEPHPLVNTAEVVGRAHGLGVVTRVRDTLEAAHPS